MGLAWRCTVQTSVVLVVKCSDRVADTQPNQHGAGLPPFAQLGPI